MLEEWTQRIEAMRDQFIDELISRGFRIHGTHEQLSLFGEVPSGLEQHSARVGIKVALPEEWPYRPTRVWPIDLNQPLSWHQESDGALCLFPAGSPGLPWADVDRLLERTTEWFARSEAGWLDDEPDLDLERYFNASEPSALLIYNDIDALTGKLLRIAKGRAGDVLEPRRSGAKSPKGTRYGWALDLGELSTPIRSWEEILARAGEGAHHADRLIRQVESAVILLKYQRGSHAGVVALRATNQDGKIRLATIESASDGDAVLRLRAGYDADGLRRFTVVLIGVGAIGSALADQLCRSGVGALRLIDYERVRPGNLVRHLVGRNALGKSKAKAVADHIKAEGYAPQRGLESVDRLVRSPEDAMQAFAAADLVIDATGNPVTSSLLESAAGGLQQRLLVVYLQRDGDVGRVERYPRLTEEAIQPPAPRGAQEHSALRESGCGDPVSPASPSAALTMAGLGSLAAADLLLGRPVPPAITYVLRPQPDVPYKARTILQ